MIYYYINKDGNYVMTDREITREGYTPITQEEYLAALEPTEEEIKAEKEV